jgi:hypothetical protein
MGWLVSKVLVASALLVAATPFHVRTVSASPATEAPAPADWMAEGPAGVLRLRLAHAEPGRRPDGGVLRVDPNRRLVAWDGVAGEVGCRRKLEAPFDRVRAVRVDPLGLLRLEVRGEPRESWVFVPLPHAAWLVQTAAAVTRGFLPDLRSTFVLGDRDGTPMPPSGSAAFMGAQVRQDLVPADVLADVRLAVERVRATLGRPALPGVEVYEALHGRPVPVGIGELLENPGVFEDRAVRVRGIAEPLSKVSALDLADGDSRLRIVPQPEIAAVVAAAERDWKGREVEVAGVVRRGASGAGGPSHEVAFWEFAGPDADSAAGAEVRSVSLRDLASGSDRFAGQLVRVVGKFRGRNLWHDLPDGGPRSGWVIKSGRQALWVVGHSPSGRGFHLDPDLERDTTRWLEVVGRVEDHGGLPVLRARTVALTAPAAFVWVGPRLRTDPHPEVVFTLPLTEDELPAADARLLVQFSSYMDEESFEGRVHVRYAGGGELRRARWIYDDVRRVLVVEPGEPLRGGATLEVALLPGIADVYAAPLDPPPGSPPGAPARVLRWRVAGSPAARAAP